MDWKCLFSVDLEDVRDQVPGGSRFRDAVVPNVDQYLRFLKGLGVRATFFVVGEVAQRHPRLIKTISDEGHEIGSHGYQHRPLTEMSPAAFAIDCQRSREILLQSGAKEVHGFRAPIFSITEKTRWAYELLAAAGFKYSSSVLPAHNPLYGWPDFGEMARLLPEGIVEIPVTVAPFPWPRVPFLGGVYFRVIPFFCLNMILKRKLKLAKEADVTEPLNGYFHPYDIDVEQEPFFHPGIKGNIFYNWLMYYGRGNLLIKLRKLLDGAELMTYGEFAARYMAKKGGGL